MPSLQLEAEPLLGGFYETIKGAELSEVTNLAIVSIAIPIGGDLAFAGVLSKVYGVDRPPPGGSSRSADGAVRFLWMAPDQLFALLEDDSPNAAATMGEKLDGKAYVTLQSDNWVALRLSGKKTRAALERMCPLDLDPNAFPEGRVARTAMEHMGAVVLREGEDSYLLLSTSSSATSFLHAVETSLRNVS